MSIAPNVVAMLATTQLSSSTAIGLLHAGYKSLDSDEAQQTLILDLYKQVLQEAA